jgi:Domain of unknown function (DUF4157)
MKWVPRFPHNFSRAAVHHTSPLSAQAQSTANSPADVYEQEAERVSEQLMSMQPEDAQEHSGRNTLTPLASSHAVRPSGQPLDETTRGFMEQRFGHDFSHVRVHTDSLSAAAAESVHSRAFTIGRDVVFAVGQYSPASAEGRRLLAHELTHVVQQGQVARPSQIMRKPPTSEPKWPSGGIQVVGADKDDLVSILSTCTGVPMSLDKQGMLVIGKNKPKGAQGGSTVAIDALRHQVDNKTFGIIIDTDPAAEAVEVGAFSPEFPGYQSIDVANIKVMAGAPGAGGGLDACSAVLHEITEAAAGRAAAREGKLKGEDLFKAAHGEGVAIEEKIRTGAGLPLRSGSGGSLQLIGSEVPDKKLLLLESMVFGSGKSVRTQINLVRFILSAPPKSGGAISGDNNVIASYVAEGEEKFSTRREAILVFNKYASKLGFRPFPVPKE